MSFLISEADLTANEVATINDWPEERRERLKKDVVELVRDRVEGPEPGRHPMFIESIEESFYGQMVSSSPGEPVAFTEGGKLVMMPVIFPEDE